MRVLHLLLRVLCNGMLDVNFILDEGGNWRFARRYGSRTKKKGTSDHEKFDSEAKLRALLAS